MSHHGKLVRGGVADGVGQPSNEITLGISPNPDSDGEGVGSEADGVGGGGEPIPDAVVGCPVGRLHNQRRLAHVRRPATLRRSRSHRHRVRTGAHASCDSLGQVGQASFADVPVADEMINRDTEEIAGSVREQTREPDVET